MAIRYPEIERDYEPRYRERDERRVEPPGRNYRSRAEDRGFIDRATDEFRSWFGDEDAERRRRRDEQDYRRTENPLQRLRVGEIMTRNVVSVDPHEPVENAARLMLECDCGAIPVVDKDDRLVGMITDRDITVRLVARGFDVRRTRVGDAMTDEVLACHVDDPVIGCMQTMSRHQIRRLPIVDDRDRVVGILSQGDLARHVGDHPGEGERRAMAKVLCAVSEPTRGSYR